MDTAYALMETNEVPPYRDVLHQAVQFLAGRCDYAETQDGVGFNKPDSFYGHELADRPPDGWTPDDDYAVWHMLVRYHRQLDDIGISAKDVPQPPRPASYGCVADWKDVRSDRMSAFRQERNAKREEEWRRRRAEQDGRKRILRMEPDVLIIENPVYDANVVEDLKQNIPGRAWDRDRRVWLAPMASLLQAVAFAARNGFEVADDVLEAMAAAGAKPAARSAAAPPSPKVERPRRFTLNRKEGLAEFRFPYTGSDPIRQHIREVDGWSYHGDDLITGTQNPDRHWTLPAAVFSIPDILDIVDEHDFEISDHDRKELERIRDEAKENAVTSRQAEAAPLPIEGLARQPFPFQWAGIRHAIKHKKVLICDSMGLGKSIQGIVATQALGAFPCIVICPANIKINWQREWQMTCPDRSVRILNSLDDPGDLRGTAEVFVVNYDILTARGQAEVTAGGKKKPKQSRVMERLKELKAKAVVIDEAQYIKSRTAGRSKMVLELTKDAEVVFPLTGTPVMNRPQELIPLLEAVNKIRAFGGSWAFLQRFCDAHKGQFGWVFGASNLPELNRRLHQEGCYIRRIKQDVIQDLPPKIRSMMPIELANRAEYIQCEEEFVKWVYNYALQDRKFYASISHLPQDEQLVLRKKYAEERSLKAQRSERLAKLNYLRLVTGRGKVKAAVEFALDTVEQGEKLIVFADHVEVQKGILDLLTGSLGPDAVASIFAEYNDQKRQANVDRFQNDEECKVIVCSLGAAGVGWTGTAASHVLFVELPWTPAAITQAEDRCYGRVNDLHGANIYFLLGDQSVDTDTMGLLDKKWRICEGVMDGREVEGTLSGSVSNDAVDAILKRHGK